MQGDSAMETPAAGGDAVLALARAPAANASEDTEARGPLDIEVLNGNLRFVEVPVIVGHYSGAALTGAERIADELIGGAMSASLALGRYCQEFKTQQVFVNSATNLNNPFSRTPRPEGLVIIGLGNEGQLRASSLTESVRLGVIAWSQHVREQRALRGEAGTREAGFVLASTIIGSGGVGVTPGQSARSIATGVFEANSLLAASDWPCVTRLRFVELFLDRATEAWRSLRLLEQVCPARYRIDPVIRAGTGSLSKPLESGYRGADYDLITAVAQPGERGSTTIMYTLDTRRARTEVRAAAQQGFLLRDLVMAASGNASVDTSIGQTLFKLLVPLEMRPFLTGATEMQIELDATTAAIPWELLDTGVDPDSTQNQPPWAIRAKLLRKLRTEEFRRQVEDTGALARMLVIGDPRTDDARYPSLAGARREARAVADQLVVSRFDPERITALVPATDTGPGPGACMVVSTLLQQDWRVVHIAAHGEAPSPGGPSADGSPESADAVGSRGVVLSGGIFLGPNEFEKMQRVPDLVFLNCCHLGAQDAGRLAESEGFHRPRFAATVADQLIRLGVRCVIATGWAVDDEAAETFARIFYDRLLQGDRFLDAVATARETTWSLHRDTNTWAAYQCYGDPEWRFMRTAGDARRTSKPLDVRYGGIASAQALHQALESIEVRLRYDSVDCEKFIERIRHLEDMTRTWNLSGATAESFARAWLEADRLDEALIWYEKARASVDGLATMHAVEQLAHALARNAWRKLRQAAAARGGLPLAPDLDPARAQLAEAIASLRGLIGLQPTMERHALCGSSFKWLAIVERMAGAHDAECDAVGHAVEHYDAAQALSVAGSGVFHPAINQYAVRLVASWAQTSDTAAVPEWGGEACDELERVNREDCSFRSLAAATGIEMYRSAAAGRLAQDLPEIRKGFDTIRKVLVSQRDWGTIYDQTEFVLGAYALRSAGAERAAALELLSLVEAWAGVDALARPAPGGAAAAA